MRKFSFAHIRCKLDSIVMVLTTKEIYISTAKFVLLLLAVFNLCGFDFDIGLGTSIKFRELTLFSIY